MTAQLPRRRLLDVSPYSSRMPVTGGTRRIHFVNRGIARAGWEVFQHAYSGMGFTGPYFSQLWHIEDRYCEYQYVNPIIVLANRVLKEASGPQIAPTYLPHMLCYSPALNRELKRADAVMIEHPHYYPLIRGKLRDGQKLIHNSHNIESMIYQASGSRLGQHAERALLAMEKALFREADLSFTCTDADRDYVIEHFGVDPERVAVAPNGTDADGMQVPTEKERLAAKSALGLADGPVAYFAGSYWDPNNEAARAIAAMARAAPHIHFVVAGTVGRAIEGAHPDNLHVLGFVDDLGPYIAAADVALNPMQSGGGSNIKVFDYLAAGLPVITTPFGARGIADDSGLALTVRELDAFPATIDALMASDRIGDIRQAARKLALDKYDWGAISAEMARKMDGLFQP